MKHRGRVPVIAIEREYQLPDVSCLLVDSELGAYTATRHVIERGCERIAMITGPATGPGSATYGRAQRYDGYCRALAASGRPVEADLVVDGNFRYESGRTAMRRLLALDRRRPDAVFAANDMMALGAMSVVREAGLRVPDDVALVGFDDVPMTGLTSPALTTMAMPMSALGDSAANLIAEQLPLAGDHTPVRKMFSAELIVRASSMRGAASLA
jgi:DNA-binding LacI/PurR family transcriptional regulator